MFIGPHLFASSDVKVWETAKNLPWRTYDLTCVNMDSAGQTGLRASEAVVQEFSGGHITHIAFHVAVSGFAV